MAVDAVCHRRSGYIVVNITVDKLNRHGKKNTADLLDKVCRWSVPLGFVVLNVVSGLYFFYG